MSAPGRPLPPALARVGIAGVTDNLPSGAGVAIAPIFIRVFRDEIERAMRPPKGESPCAPTSPRGNANCR